PLGLGLASQPLDLVARRRQLALGLGARFGQEPVALELGVEHVGVHDGAPHVAARPRFDDLGHAPVLSHLSSVVISLSFSFTSSALRGNFAAMRCPTDWIAPEMPSPKAPRANETFIRCTASDQNAEPTSS